jgi:iron complex transport system permease protein
MKGPGMLLGLLALCVGAAVLGLCVGPSGWRPMWDALGLDAISALRAPRVVLAALMGASLAVAGTGMQTLLRNDLADPYVLGLSGGAALGAVLSLLLWPGVAPGPAAAAGAAVAALIVRALARGPHDGTRLAFGGIAVGSLLMSGTGLLLVLAPGAQLLRSSTFWLFGGLGTPRWPALVVPAMLLAGAILWMLWRAERLDRLALGEDVATTLGVDVRVLRAGIFVVAVALTASAVAVGGLVGFVGLVAPHAARRLVGATHRALLPIAALGGALLVLCADTVARTAFAPVEIPVGLVTAMVGGPFFLWLLSRGGRRWASWT